MQLSHFAQSRASNVKLATVRVVIEENSLAQRSQTLCLTTKFIYVAHILTFIYVDYTYL